MTDVFYAVGRFGDFADGTFATEPLAYVLGRAGAEPFKFAGGTALVYDLGPVLAFGTGTALTFSHGWAVLGGVPLGAFKDFALSGSTDPLTDGIQISPAPFYTASPEPGQPWGRFYTTCYPPTGTRYVVPLVQFWFSGINTDPHLLTAQYFAAHQFEVLPYGSVAPTTFHSARSLLITVRPARLNYATGSTTVTNLTPGKTYTASATVNGQRVSYTLQPTTSTVTLDFGVAGTPTKILVEEGTEVGDYFDGSYGEDYLWEQGGTPGQTRSYYYPDRVNRRLVLKRVLQENVALGALVEEPQFAVLPAPTTSS